MRSIAFVLSLCAAAAMAAPAADEVTSLPGWSGPLPSKQYSGYLNAGGAKKLHYWYSAAESDSKFLTLWLNGGPGCSSLDGFFYENGQIHFNDSNSNQLVYNPYNWATQSNMLYLEAPVGVGFSYSTDRADYAMNDNTTADASFTGLVDFFTNKFPELADKEFYIAGESYAGVYVPTLANRIRVGNLNGESNINLRGMLVGNGCTGTETGTCGQEGDKYRSEFLWRHALFADSLHDEIENECGKDWANPSLKCEELLLQQSEQVGDVDIYNILAPCISSGSAMAASRVPSTGILAKTVGGPNGCIDSGAAHAYLNQQSVQEALHVASAQSEFKEWVICSSKIDYTSNIANLPRDVYPQLIKEYNVLVFNGDLDACVPVNDNEEWTSGMGFPVAKGWTAWEVQGGQQTAGYITHYTTQGNGSFAFTTVKGSGHMVPQYTPEAALHMFTSWINGQSF